MGGLITRRHEPRLSSLRGVCVQTGEHGHAPKYTLLSRRLRRFIYLLDSCPEPLTRFSTGAASPTKHTASPSPAAEERACHTPAESPHPRVPESRRPPRRACRVMGMGSAPAPPPPFSFLFWLLLSVFPLSFPLLFHAFPPARLLSGLTLPHPSLFPLVFRPHSLPTPLPSLPLSCRPQPPPFGDSRAPVGPAALTRIGDRRARSTSLRSPRPGAPASWEAGPADPAERAPCNPRRMPPFPGLRVPPPPSLGLGKPGRGQVRSGAR